MKRILSWFAALLMLFACAGGAWADSDPQSSGTDQHATSIDAVIVLDQSSSMHSVLSNSDPLDYRLDAAQMFIGMCDITKSRVAFLPFSGRIHTSDKTDFIQMSDTQSRQEQLKHIEKLRGDVSLGANTDVGVALTAAVKLLINRSDTTNQPMILLLTDGKNDVGDPTDKKVDVWDPASQTFVLTMLRKYNNDMADQLSKSACEVAKSHQIPIYTIALYSEKKGLESNDVREYVNNLQNMSDETNGLSTAVSSADALRLPEFFGSMFATQIGSTLLKDMDLTIYEIKDKPGRFAMDLPILNRSVMEANVFIPLVNLNPEQIWLFDADNVDRSSGSRDVLTSSSKYFRLFKITNPRSLGNWRLEFEPLVPGTAIKDISFSLLYNYDISLRSQIGKSASTLDEIGAGLSLAKDESIHISARFYDSNGVPSNDSNLYAIQNGPAWETIRGTYELLDARGNVMFTGGMKSQGDCFTADVDLKTAALSSEGKNMLRSGAYTLRIIAQGAGLHRENELPITLRNNAPIISINPLIEFVYVDDPEKPETQKPQTITMNLSKYVRDSDNDLLLFSELKPVGQARDILDMKIVTMADGTIAAVGTTIYDQARKLFKYGTARYTLTVSDQEETLDLTLEVTVRSKTVESLNAYVCETIVDGLGPQDIAPKNSDVTFRMHLNSKETKLADTFGAVKDFHGAVYIFRADNTDTYLQKIDMALDNDGTQLIGVYRTTNAKADLKAVCMYTFGHAAQDAGEFEQLFHVENHPPQLAQAAVDALPKKITFDPLPAGLAFLEAATPDADLTISMPSLFMDQDNETGLVFSAPTVAASADVDAMSLLQVHSDGQTVRLVPVGAGQVTLSITATDGDNETVTVTHTVAISSVSVKWMWIAIASVLALALLALCIILWVLKHRPWFPKDSTLATYENAAVFPSNHELVPSQKTIPLSRCVDMEMADRTGISIQLLERICIKPVRSPGDHIAVKQVKQFPGYLVELDGVPLKKSAMHWAPGHELKLMGRGNTSYLRVQFLMDTPDNGYGGLYFEENGGSFGQPSVRGDFSNAKDFGGFDEGDGQGGFGNGSAPFGFGGFEGGNFGDNGSSGGDAF